MTDTLPEKQPFDGQCGTCNHVWTIVYFPMEVEALAEAIEKAHCPICGDKPKNILIP